MKTEIMEKLKTELVAVKEIIDKFGVFDIAYLDLESEKDFLNGFNYFVIMEDGTCFYIVLGSDVFPYIDFTNIVYIRKRRGLSVDEMETTKEYIDTEDGEFDQNWVTDKDIEMVKKFNTDFTRQIDTGGYN